MSRVVSLDLVVELLEEGNDLMGICHACGETTEPVEPDARKYPCDACGCPQVYGLEETVLMLA